MSCRAGTQTVHNIARHAQMGRPEAAWTCDHVEACGRPQGREEHGRTVCEDGLGVPRHGHQGALRLGCIGQTVRKRDRQVWRPVGPRDVQVYPCRIQRHETDRRRRSQMAIDLCIQEIRIGVVRMHMLHHSAFRGWIKTRIQPRRLTGYCWLSCPRLR
jgi:hypothetical protein